MVGPEERQGFETFEEELSPLEEACRQNQVQLEHALSYYAARVEEIGSRLAELEEELDLDTAMMTAAAGATIVGTAMSIVSGSRWLLLPLAAAGLALQHAGNGWGPLATLLYRLGFRTNGEIDAERYALKALRGDFRELPTEGDCTTRAKQTLAAVWKNAKEE